MTRTTLYYCLPYDVESLQHYLKVKGFRVTRQRAERLMKLYRLVQESGTVHPQIVTTFLDEATCGRKSRTISADLRMLKEAHLVFAQWFRSNNPL